ncbi:ScbA/BarX family gamma-butyrolactone biosynthesis protein [Streptomyces sp. NBC_01298]|uniref:ScbA/BarX family gamma-butyrolactone biosynthesis protein n=1 Tax=Streptomyces sp. NBC_01298 TaxID=2903817 RepID=UPI002E13DD81|nr:ScbA/BarX family gamma-butyrolactone biosynthesis protein [Streptomyces sp. NBC_01298]
MLSSPSLAPGPVSRANLPRLPWQAPPGSSPRNGALTFDRTVPRSLVHRASVAEVFLTDGRRGDGNRVRIAAQWPRHHALYQPDAEGSSDPLLLVETVRQAAIYTAHRFHDVPLTHSFIFRDLDFHLVDPGALVVGGEPLPLVLDGSFVPEAHPSGNRIGARFEAWVETGGRRCARVSVRLLAVGAELYGLLRDRRAPAARGRGAAADMAGAEPRMLDAAEVGRQGQENVLLSVDRTAAPGRYLMRVDRDHPGYFEHSCDHVPGMALVEAFRQAGCHLVGTGRESARDGSGHRAAPWSLAFSEVRFDAFGELREPTVIKSVGGVAALPSTGRHGLRRVQLAAVQGDRTIARSTALYRPRVAVEPSGEGNSWNSSISAPSAK